ncbi:tetratricopeptide repeat protein [filamentous cyanobacterium LEGE 11480]|uniref:Tetratricopeptide repeat protein n=1 Tax=Romeriopsis navalis LEGE 11480 TaxID=2777977 RepID=A0A928VRM9_9CYAN|nr:tetratricopeptide repeat protein [Romeriopsis navalis]MBE9032487.1 tetratricopeptide repeat protein [Romeriopsis navalis LEGE 11480]
MLFPKVSVVGAVCLESARIHFHSRRYRSAWLALRQALELNPNCVEAWHLAGVIFHQVDQPAAAMVAYNRVLSIAPNDYITWYSRGRVLELLGDRTAAISSYGAVIAGSPNYQDAARRRDRLIQQYSCTPI